MRSLMRIVLIACLIASLAACNKPPEAPANETASAPAQGPVKGADRSHRGSPAPAITFNDADGQETTLASFAGKPTLVNLWASWCAPCVKELPTLDRLARASDGKLNVIAVSQDNGPRASVVAFLQANRIVNLDPYQDSPMALSGALGPETVLPTSILYDAKGKEVWRFVGDLDWTSPEATKLLAEAGAPSAA
jgi:thiol-disulfide isomerase/thioredoxin